MINEIERRVAGVLDNINSSTLLKSEFYGRQLITMDRRELIKFIAAEVKKGIDRDEKALGEMMVNVAKTEREACAKVTENIMTELGYSMGGYVADQIRMRAVIK